MLDDLPALLTFARIVAAGSLSAAARELDLPLSVVSKRLARLEQAAGVRLIQRTTRRQALTEEGALFHARVLRILDEIEQAETWLLERRDQVTGVLRLTAPSGFGRQWLAPLIAEFQRLHPQLAVQLDLSDSLVDLVDSGHDMAIRVGKLPDSSLAARELAPNFRVLCAAPSYVERHGVPRTPADLAAHRCIVIGNQRSVEWQFEGAAKAAVRVTGALVTNDGDAAHRFALEGAGIALKSIWDVGNDLRAGRLQRVLAGYAMPAAPLHAIYPHARTAVPRVRAFVDIVRERLQAQWRWSES